MLSITITKRSGMPQKYQVPKQNKYLDQLCSIVPRLSHCNTKEVAKQVTLGANMSTVELAEHVAEVCASCRLSGASAAFDARTLRGLPHLPPCAS